MDAVRCKSMRYAGKTHNKSKPCPPLLRKYQTKMPNLPEEAVIILAHEMSTNPWEDLTEEQQTILHEQARTALTQTLPAIRQHIAAEVQEEAQAAAQQQREHDLATNAWNGKDTSSSNEIEWHQMGNWAARVITHGRDLKHAWLTEQKRAAAEAAWEAARQEIRTIPHWYDPEKKYGEFDLAPTGPNETTEHGAFMAVMEALSTNPYRTKGD